MTDLTPNNLSHLSDEEFIALCPRGEHAPGPEPLSPAAMAVLDAFLNGCICNSADNSVAFQADRNGLAAALRALADQVKPALDRTPWLTNEDGYFNETLENMEALGELNVHYHLLAIAAELENAQ